VPPPATALDVAPAPAELVLDVAGALVTTPSDAGPELGLLSFFAVDWLDAELPLPAVDEALDEVAGPAEAAIGCHWGAKVIASPATSGKALISQRLTLARYASVRGPVMAALQPTSQFPPEGAPVQLTAAC
jgi:hypothetical protein